MLIGIANGKGYKNVEGLCLAMILYKNMKSSRSSRKARKAKKIKSAERPSHELAKKKFGGLKEISLQNIVVRAKAQAAE